MWSAEAVLVCALELLGRKPDTFPPVTFVSSRPADVSPNAEAFVRIPDPQIYVLTTTPRFQRLQRAPDRCGDFEALRKLASVLVHEEVHATNRGDEAQAYAAQLTTLNWLGSGVGTPLYNEVMRSMRSALARERRRPPGGLLVAK